MNDSCCTNFKPPCKTSADALNDPEYGFEKIGNAITLKETSIWYDQVQTEMLVANKDLCFLLLYIPKHSFIATIKADVKWRNKVPLLIDFYWATVFPKLMAIA